MDGGPGPWLCGKSSDVPSKALAGWPCSPALPSSAGAPAFLPPGLWPPPSCFLEAVLSVQRPELTWTSPSHTTAMATGASTLRFSHEKSEKMLDREDKDEGGTRPAGPTGCCGEGRRRPEGRGQGTDGAGGQGGSPPPKGLRAGSQGGRAVSTGARPGCGKQTSEGASKLRLLFPEGETKGEKTLSRTRGLGGEGAANRLMCFPEGSGAPPRAAGTASELSALSSRLGIIEGHREGLSRRAPSPGHHPNPDRSSTRCSAADGLSPKAEHTPGSGGSGGPVPAPHTRSRRAGPLCPTGIF